ncbi:MGMT family protein [Pseudonocardia sp. NPDC049154]|uniref:MGMT family protein n=1 Tax=Pseudonocardia sp. NPDC049154 TaxID=3155501 RepID=UPI003405796B
MSTPEMGTPGRTIVAAVREVVASIPAGFVASYGDVSRRIGTGPRQVGRAMGLLDDAPWWRVVYADGTPASCHGGRAVELLDEEGTPMLAGRAQMHRARHHWDAPDVVRAGENYVVVR